MDPFLRAVETAFEQHGIEATLDPDGAALLVRLLPMRGDDIADFGSMQIQEPGGVFEILASVFAGHDRGATLEIGGERRRVKHTQVRDPRRFKVQLNTVPL